MKVSIDQEALTRLLKRAMLSSGAALNPIHQLVKLEAKGPTKTEPSCLAVSGTSGLMSISTSVRCEVSQPGVVAANTKDLHAAASAMPMGSIALSTTASHLRLVGSSGRRCERKIADATAIQPVPEPVNLPWLRVPLDTARVAIDRVSYATNNIDADFRAFDGVRFEAKPGELMSVCASRYQMVTYAQKAAVELKGKQWQATLPTNALGHLREIFDEAQREDQPYVDLYEDQHFLYALGPCTLFVAALPTGEYLNYELMLSNFPSEALCTVPRLALIESLKSCILTSTSKLEPGAMFAIKGGELTIYRNDKEGNFSETLALPACRPDLNINFKAAMQLMLELLKGADVDPEIIHDGATGLLARTSTGYRSALALLEIRPGDVEGGA